MDLKSNLPITIIMGDSNGLKIMNDSFGHTTGDELLKTAANLIKEGCAGYDVIVRYGGDEFAAGLPNTDG